MNEDMLQMARKAGFSDHSNPEMWGYMIASVEELARFAALIRADEREACAKVCDEQRDLREEARAALRAADALKSGDHDMMLSALRHDSDVRLYHAGIDKCAAAIRERKS